MTLFLFFLSLFILTFSTGRYQFRVSAPENEFLIFYNVIKDIQANHIFSPAVYLIEQVRTGNYLIEYSLSLSDQFSYLLESYGSVRQKGNGYQIAVSDGDFYIVFNASQNPIDLSAEQQSEKMFDKIDLICFAIIFVLVVACVTLWIIYLKQRKRE